MGIFRPRSILAQIAHVLVGAGEEKFKTLKVSLREHEIDQVRTFVYHVFHAGPFAASRRGVSEPDEWFVVTVNRYGMPGPLLVFQGAWLDLADNGYPATSAKGE